MGTQTTDAIIIGTGVIGAAIAFELAKKRTVDTVDRPQQAGRSWFNCRVLCDHPHALFDPGRHCHGL